MSLFKNNTVRGLWLTRSSGRIFWNPYCMKMCPLVTECTRLSKADHAVAQLKKDYMVKGLIPVLCIKETNCVKKLYYCKTCSKSHFYNHINALNCTTQSKAAEKFVNRCICKCVPQFVPVVAYDVPNVSSLYCTVLTTVKRSRIHL
jgi:hypothetical protein